MWTQGRGKKKHEKGISQICVDTRQGKKSLSDMMKMVSIRCALTHGGKRVVNSKAFLNCNNYKAKNINIFFIIKASDILLDTKSSDVKGISQMCGHMVTHAV